VAGNVVAGEPGRRPGQGQARPVAVPPVYPVPQRMQLRPGSLAIPATVGLVADDGADRPALRVLARALHSAGVARVIPGTPGSARPGAGLVCRLGTPADDGDISPALASLSAEGPQGLPPGGYVLAAGQQGSGGTVVLAGADHAGVYYAAQTLRQLLAHASARGSRLPAMVIRDWPAVGIRGVAEAFYGPPWSMQARASHFAFQGSVKMNTYLYSPKDDPHLRARWRDAYSPRQLRLLKALVQRAEADHVQFVYALSPGLSVCYSSTADLRHIISKFQQVWDIGVRAFALLFDDISYLKWNCREDETAFGEPSPGHAAAAQVHLVNSVVRHFMSTRRVARPLQFVPTEYYDTSPSPYKRAIASDLDRSVHVLWTGTSVVAPRITAADAAAAREAFGHPIVVCDNYPVNDYTPDRLLMGPYCGRSVDLAGEVGGILANPMPQEKASRVALSTVADFAWNPAGYGRSLSAAWETAVRASGGQASAAAIVFADSNRSSILDPDEAPGLSRAITGFWAARAAGSRRDWLRAASRLQRCFSGLAGCPAELRAALDAGFLREIAPWLTKLGCYGRAGELAVQAMLAEQAGDSAAALLEALAAERSRLARMPAQVAPGVIDAFLAEVLSRSRACPAATMSLTCPVPVTRPGDPLGYPGRVMTTVTGTVTNTGGTPIRQVTMSLSVPPGWTATRARPRPLGCLKPGTSTRARWTLHSPAAPVPGPAPVLGWADLTGDKGGRGAAVARGTLWVPYRSLTEVFDNVGVTDDHDVAPPGLNGGLDGHGASLSAAALREQGIRPGASVTAAGFTFTWPCAPPGQPNNVVADGQCIAVAGGGTALGFLTAAARGPVAADAVVMYADGTMQPVTLASRDWQSPADPAQPAICVAYHNAVGAGQVRKPVQLCVAAAVLEPGRMVAAVRLPEAGGCAAGKAPSLHVFALALRQ
jgi:hyaluronoglucosaminidase